MTSKSGTGKDQQCGDTTTVMSNGGPGGLEMPVKPKCIRDDGHGGPHSNGRYNWR